MLPDAIIFDFDAVVIDPRAPVRAESYRRAFARVYLGRTTLVDGIGSAQEPSGADVIVERPAELLVVLPCR